MRHRRHGIVDDLRDVSRQLREVTAERDRLAARVVAMSAARDAYAALVRDRDGTLLRAEAAEADRAKLARRVAELEAEVKLMRTVQKNQQDSNAELHLLMNEAHALHANAQVGWTNAEAERDKLAERIEELEAELVDKKEDD